MKKAVVIVLGLLVAAVIYFGARFYAAIAEALTRMS